MSLNEITYMNWREIIKPEKVQIASQTPTYGKFVWEPLERGFGITIGNSLRRIILSSICGSAIVSVKFDGVMHEFSTIPGVLEDVSEIILNLKNVRVKMEDSEPRMIEINATAESVITAPDIISGDGRAQVMNPDLHIATRTTDAKFRAEMTAKAGKGYSLDEVNKDPEAPVGTIAINSVYSPHKRVNYRISNARIGQKTELDKLTMEVWTDGSVSPEESIAYGAKILKEQMNVFINFDEDLEPELTEKVIDDSKPRQNENLYLDVDELELSVRSANCLRNANITKIFQLVRRTEPEMLKTKNFGRKSLNEIKELLAELGLSLGMNIDSFEPPEDDDDTDQGE